MKSEIKELWLEDLRSGNYKQAQGTLKGEQQKGVRASYCCLGVLCNIYKRETGEGAWTKDGSFDVGKEKDTSGVLPVRVRNWAGLNKTNPRVQSGGKYNDLASLNDGDAIDSNGESMDRKTFKQIADLVEVCIPG